MKKKLFLLCVHHETKVDMKKAVKLVGASNSFRFAGAADLEATLNVPQGSVSPLAAINDTEHKVTIVLDASMDCAKPVLVHPCTNQASSQIAFADLKAFLEGLGSTVTVVDFGGAAPAAAPAAGKAKAKKEPKAKPAKKEKGGKQKQQPKAKAKKEKGGKGNNEDGLTATKSDNFALWYKQVVEKSEMIEYYNISGCYILRPWSFEIWDKIHHFFDAEIKKLGVRNSYFPLFVSEEALIKEADHIEDFAPEVAWVTKSGDGELAKPIAIRPTSETIMYPAFKKWIRSHRDLPLKLNQWTNVVRWEFKNPTPFLRTREFLWQEGHTAFADVKEADAEVIDILDLYARVYEELMAIPVVKGRKSEGERFPGGRFTTTVEAFIPAAKRAIQGATSHSLGQNFAKMFNIEFEDPMDRKKKKMPWQNSWGLTTRSIGVLIMVHGDDKGLVLPPRMAPFEVVIVCIEKKGMSEEDIAAMWAKADELSATLAAAGVRCKVDDRQHVTGGWKFNYWELRGVPMIMTLGQNEMKSQTAELGLRINATKKREKGVRKPSVAWDSLATEIPKMLESIQAQMLASARKERDAHISVAMNMEEFKRELNKGNLILAPWCELKSTEDLVKEMTRNCGTSAEKKSGPTSADDLET